MSEPSSKRLAGPGSTLHVFTTSACRHLIEEHQRLFADRADAVIGHVIETDVAANVVLDALAPEIHLWEALRERTGRATRYNNPLRFVRRAAAAPADGAGTQPLSVLLVVDGRAEALLTGFYAQRAKPRGARQRGLRELSRLAPALRGWRLPESTFVVDDAPEAIALAVAYLSEILSGGIVERLELENIEADTPLHAALTRAGALPGPIARTEKSRWMRRMVDPDTGEVLEHNSGKTRHGIRRKHKQLAKRFEGGLVLSRITHPEEVDDFVTHSACIVRQTYQAALGIGATDTPEYKSFCREIAEDDNLRGYLLTGFDASGESVPVAYVIGDVEGGQYHLWATSFVPEYGKHSPGMVLVRLAIEDLQAEGIGVLDFGDGEAQYKEMFGSDRVAEQDLCAYGPRPGARIGHAFDRGSARLVGAARTLLERGSLLSRIRNALR